MSALREAVEEAVREAVAEADGTQGLIVSEFVLIALTNGFDSDGEHISQVITIPEDGSESRILGLLDHAQARLRFQIMDD